MDRRSVRISRRKCSAVDPCDDDSIFPTSEAHYPGCSTTVALARDSSDSSMLLGIEFSVVSSPNCSAHRLSAGWQKEEGVRANRKDRWLNLALRARSNERNSDRIRFRLQRVEVRGVAEKQEQRKPKRKMCPEDSQSEGDLASESKDSGRRKIVHFHSSFNFMRAGYPISASTSTNATGAYQRATARNAKTRRACDSCAFTDAACLLLLLCAFFFKQCLGSVLCRNITVAARFSVLSSG